MSDQVGQGLAKSRTVSFARDRGGMFLHARQALAHIGLPRRRHAACVGTKQRTRRREKEKAAKCASMNKQCSAGIAR